MDEFRERLLKWIAEKRSQLLESHIVRGTEEHGAYDFLNSLDNEARWLDLVDLLEFVKVRVLVPSMDVSVGHGMGANRTAKQAVGKIVELAGMRN